jgi:hypothetical protein
MMWFDVGIVFLLITALGFCWKLSDKLQSLKGVTNTLMPSVVQLSQVLQKAANSVGYLKEATDKSNEGIANYLPHAQNISSELGLLIEHADRLSYRLDDLINKADSIEKDLRQTVLVCMRQIEHNKKQNNESEKVAVKTTVTEKNDPRDLFVQRVISRYPKDTQEISAPSFPEGLAKWQEI